MRPFPRAYLLPRLDHRRDLSLRSRCSARPSTVLRSPRTPAPQRSISPSAYTSHLAATTAVETGLPCSALLLQRVLRSIPRRDSMRVFVRTLALRAWPSPWRERLGSRIVSLSRLQASLHVAARVVAPSAEAVDVPLGTRGSLPAPGTCYPALRRLPGRDFHPLEKCSVKPRSAPLPRALARVRHGAPRRRA